MKIPYLLSALLAFTLAFAPETTLAQTTEKAKPETPNLKLYYVAFLVAGPNRSQSPEEARQIQDAHMAHMQKMADDGKLIIAGPFAEAGDLRGLFIFNVPTLEEAKALTASDPAVKAGRLKMEIRPWYSEPGNCLK